MPPRHKADSLEPKIRKLISSLLKRPRGVDEFTALANGVLEEHGSDMRLSRSSAYRFMRDFEDERKAMRETREITKAFAQELEDMPGNDYGRLLMEMLNTVIFKVIRPQITMKEPTVDSDDLMKFARALRDNAIALKSSIDTELKVRKEVAAELTAKLDAAAGEAAKAGEKGLSEERIAQLREDFLGVRTKAST